MSVLSAVSKLTSLLEEWDKDVNNTSESPISVLTRIAELVEEETETWYKTDPDPFDDRHPGRTDPNCALGHLLKAAFKNDAFMNKLVNSYLTDNRADTELQTISCRLLLDLMPGLEAAIVFQENEALVRRLVQLAQCKAEPLSSYATGLLGEAMGIQDIAANFKESNALLVPEILNRLHTIKDQVETAEEIKITKTETPEKLKRPFAGIHNAEGLCLDQPLSANDSPEKKQDEAIKSDSDISKQIDNGGIDGMVVHSDGEHIVAETCKANGSVQGVSPCKKEVNHEITLDTPCSKKRKLNFMSPSRENTNENSNSSWALMKPFVIGTYRMWPLEKSMQQRLLLQYLIPMGEYQELLSHVFEKRAVDLIFYYLNLRQNTDVRLAFESTKYLAALLCHKKFAIEFITLGGVEKLLSVPRPSVAATGVSMCLYYMAYFEDAMERVCLLPNQVLNNMVSFVLWLLECSHESGRCNATMFFSMSFPFRIILEMFDAQDGLRKLCNIMSTLQILNTESEDSSHNISEDGVFMSRQSARHVCVALKKYFEAHLAIKADQLRRSHFKSDGTSPVSQIPHYKATKFPAEVVQSNKEVLLDYLPLRLKWEAASQFLKLGGPTLLLQLVAMAAEWNAYTGKAETIKSALDVLAVCSVTPSTQLLLCDSIPLPDNVASPAVSVLLGLAEGDFLPDPEVQKAALSVIINCVCGPSTRYNSAVARITGNSAKKKLSAKSGDDLLSKMWENLRANNGIMVLLKLMMIKTPVTEADAIHALACKALDGLTRSDTIKQIVSKLPLFNNGQLQMSMREPVLQDKRQEYLKFCKHATALMEKVSGKPQNTHFDISLERIRKADIVAQTKIVYQEKELLQLIQEHLLSKDLQETANILQREAELPRCSTPPVIHPETPYLFSPGQPAMRLVRQFSTPTGITSSQSGMFGGGGSSRQQMSVLPAATTTSSPATPIKINIINSKTTGFPAQLTQNRPTQTRKMVRQKQDTPTTSFLSPSIRRSKPHQDATVSLDKIVTEYLRKQHSGCRNPVATCPPFSLLQPHMCPEPRRKNLAPTNLTSRMIRKTIYPPYGGSDGRKCDRKYIYSRFRPVKSYRDTEDDGCFSCCTFSADEAHLLLGTYAGELKQVQLQSGEETSNYVCHSSPMNHCETTRDGNLVLTCSSWGQPVSALWSLGQMFDMKHGFDDDNYMEFSKQVQDRILGTKEETAHIYDVSTGRLLNTLHDQDKANNYAWNRATFNPTDDLVLNDGVLWDINSGKSIHKFDKFNPNISGVFHPNGLEIIINSEVWDLRTFHLLHTVPGLDQCQIRFNQKGDVIYGAIHQNDDTDMDDDQVKSPFGSSFRTFDGTDYSNIATKDVSKNIFDLCTDSSDCYLAVVENLRNQDTLSEESVCRLYEVGRIKDEEDDRDQDDDESDDALNDDDAGDDDDDDDDSLDLETDEEEEEDGGGSGNNREERANRRDGENSGSTQATSESSNSSESGSNSSENREGDEEEDEFELLSESDIEDSDSEDDDDILFELSDISNGPWNS